MSNLQGEAGEFFYVLEDDLRILFVDDDPILREFAVVHLSTDKAKVKVAGDGQEALDRLAEEPFDLVLLDLEMPKMDGFQLLDRLRASEQHRNLPVIVVTGREDVAAIDRAFLAGATSFVIKPLNWRLISYQIRYVQRACKTERSLRDARSRARAEASEAAAAMRKLAQETAQFLRAAASHDPAVRDAGRRFAQAISEAAEPVARRQRVTG